MNANMKDREKFLKLIKKNPYDLVTRKVFADYLDEYGSDSDFELAEEQRKWTKEKQDAIIWMTDLAEYITNNGKNSYEFLEQTTKEESYEMTYEQLIEIGKIGVTKNHTHNFDGFDTPNRCLYEMKDFWKNFELITGIEVENKEQEIFSCSC